MRFPEYDGPETFQLLATRWDIQKAWQLIKAGDIKFIESELDIGEASRWLAFIRIDNNFVDAMDDERLQEPVLLTSLDAGVIPIDGWHRIARASIQGIPYLPCVFIPDDSLFRM